MIDPQPAAATAPRNPNIAPFNSAHHDRLCRIGLWLGVLSAALCITAGFGDRIVAEQGTKTEDLPAGAFIGVGVTFAVLFGLAVFLQYAWSRITGIGLLGAAAFAYGVMVTVARASDLFVVGPDIKVGSAGLMLVLAFAAACAGLTFALVGAPRIGRPARRGPDGQVIPGQSGYAVTSLVLSLCALAVGFTAPLGIAFAVAAFDDNTRSGGARGGRGMAVAGLVVGIVIVAFSALIMAALLGSADPSIKDG